jgi:hypothetical protein
MWVFTSGWFNTALDLLIVVFPGSYCDSSSNPRTSSSTYIDVTNKHVVSLPLLVANVQATRQTSKAPVQSRQRRPQPMPQRMACSSWRRRPRQQQTSMSCSVRSHASSPRQRQHLASSSSSQALCWTHSHSLQPGRAAAARVAGGPADCLAKHGTNRSSAYSLAGLRSALHITRQTADCLAARGLLLRLHVWCTPSQQHPRLLHCGGAPCGVWQLGTRRLSLLVLLSCWSVTVVQWHPV